MGYDMQPPVVGNLLRVLADLHLLRHRAVPQGDDLVFFRIVVLHAALRFFRASFFSRRMAATCHSTNWRYTAAMGARNSLRVFSNRMARRSPGSRMTTMRLR